MNKSDHPRCFLYLVNYARMKPEIALKALPALLEVRAEDMLADGRC